jgi:hypothetical protein
VLAMREPEAVGEIEPAEIEDLGRRHGS